MAYLQSPVIMQALWSFRMTENLATLVIVCHIFSPHGFDMLVQLSLLGTMFRNAHCDAA